MIIRIFTTWPEYIWAKLSSAIERRRAERLWQSTEDFRAQKNGEF